MSVDDALRAAVRAELAAAGLGAEQLGERIGQALDAAFARREAERLISQAELARLLGLTPKALSMRLSRGSDLLALARIIDSKRVWLKSEILGLAQRHAPRLQAVRDGGSAP